MTGSPKINIYTDGACSGNPGNGGYGTILCYTDTNNRIHEKELTEGYKNTTNNQMELMAVIVGLEALKQPCEVTIYSDSKYVIEAFDKGWIQNWISHGWKTAGKKPVKNIELWQRLLKAKEQHDVNFVWVKGHAGHEYNERCDRLAVKSSQSVKLKEVVF